MLCMVQGGLCSALGTIDSAADGPGGKVLGGTNDSMTVPEIVLL